MALILNTNDNQQGFYKKILIDKCYANIDGLYIAVAVFKSKADREKDKLRSNDIQTFLSNIEFKIEEIKNIQDETLKIEQSLLFEPVIKIITNFFSHIYKGLGDELNLSLFSEKEISSAKEYGFKKEWIEDPVIVVSQDTMWIEEYKQQEFNIESFYELLKNKIYTDQNGNLLVENDL